LDEGFYPWNYYPYYAYNDYPSEYYPDYYADAQYNPDTSSVPLRDSNVAVAQADLAELGYYSGPVDGIYGPATSEAVRRYQNDNHLAVTGTLTLQTLESLEVS
jgi:peptidoglycan hydrolase-like protein with peptidoglycan-binding domain